MGSAVGSSWIMVGSATMMSGHFYFFENADSDLFLSPPFLNKINIIGRNCTTAKGAAASKPIRQQPHIPLPLLYRHGSILFSHQDGQQLAKLSVRYL